MSTTTSQQFEGSTIEEALAAAVECFGDDLEVINAQRVRRRKAFGIRRRETYEVTATPRATAEPKGFEEVLARMVDRVDSAERSLGADLADTSNAWWSEAEFLVPEAISAGRERGLGDGSVSHDRLDPAVFDLRDPGIDPDPDIDLGDGVGSGAAPAASPPPRHASPASDGRLVWSRERLIELGLPAALVRRVRVPESADDLQWVGSLASAIDELLDAAAPITGPCELTGHGVSSAVQLIRGACDGFGIGSIVIDDKPVPATSLELALAIRALLRDEATQEAGV